jgi:DNA-binding transcriptional MerR regulator
MYSIGRLSQLTNVSNETIRYYERIDLLPSPQRATNGYRKYDETDVDRLQFVRRLRSLDFTLDEIREILAFKERQEPPCQYVMSVMDKQIHEIEQRMRDLQKLQSEIKSLYDAGANLPDDVQMKTCVCHLIQIGGDIDTKKKSPPKITLLK